MSAPAFASPVVDGASSILFPVAEPLPVSLETPECFADLNLDQVVARIASGVWSGYQLAPLLYAAPVDRQVIEFRQEVMRETERADLRPALVRFSQRMRTMRSHLEAQARSEYPLEAARFFLAAVETYVDAVRTLGAALTAVRLRSSGLRRWRETVAAYEASPGFRALAADCARTVEGLARVAYLLLVDGLEVTVLPYRELPDYAVEVERMFARFRTDATADDTVRLADAGRLNHVEAAILERVARLDPPPFKALETFVASYPAFVDPGVRRFDAELPYYLAYTDAIQPLREAGLSFAYPSLSASDRTLELREAFDLALAWKLRERGLPVVSNDAAIGRGERLLVVSGPNSGGKTTFARMIGQAHYLARLGYPVPGRAARCFIYDRIWTHFERVEDPRSGRGKLRDELLRIRHVVDEATPQSLVVMNEIFASTTVRDALYLGRRILGALSARDVTAVCVTFLDELAEFDDRTVSYVAAVDTRDPAVRTFRLERRPADGLAYALAVAEKHRVTRDWLLWRISSCE